MNFEDFLGNTVEEGDTVLYAAMSGRSVQMVRAKVLTIREKSITVEPMDSARWRQHYGRTKYLDDKGKPFDPYGPKAAKHTARPVGYIDKDTGEWQESWNYPPSFDRMPWELRHEIQEERRRRFEFAPVVWKDYVRIEKVPAKVTLTVMSNIVLIEKTSVTD